MKKFTLILFIFSLLSCNSEQNNEKIQHPFDQGLEILQATKSLQKNDYITALGLFEKTLQEYPENIEAKYWKAHCELHSGQFENALSTSKNIVEDVASTNHKLLPDFNITAGLTSIILGDTIGADEYFEKAIVLYDERITAKPEDISSIMNKALALCYLNKQEEAIHFIESVQLSDKKKQLLEQITLQVKTFDANKEIEKLTTVN